MRVLDKRPRSVRIMSRLWGSSDETRGRRDARPGPAHPLARLSGAVAAAIISRRVAARRPVVTGPAVVSVGNLALGGTGKTPVTMALAAGLAATGRRGAVLTRGFGSQLSGPLTVDQDDVLAGDEARLMASGLSAHGWPVIQARHRASGLEYLRRKFPDTEIVIVEDGHQTAGLGRHLDVVILDSWTVVDEGAGDVISPVTGPVLPFGPWRETAAGASRAGIWLLETDAPVIATGAGGQAVTTFRRKLILRAPSDGRPVSGQTGRYAVLSGIARPEAFERSVSRVLANDPVLAVRYGDHARYGTAAMTEILAAVRGAGADFLVTTAKDWVKIKHFGTGSLPVQVANLEILWGSDKALPALVGDRLGAVLSRSREGGS